ncbi:3-deoxy-D-manno-octulosonic acid transferase [Roseivirga sp. E12]|uniref:3-deoxy-D-manno-octulosonic acid transferase n=1 Tax=Roseivirga sp. E12 TaxID=2819237 RepID=UPI001ABC8AD5|nr:glycosyltransferase N-terminal domain-containing protein [Roseivirga sp. E12]MBO3698290.1 3-deoxy-D-manno-octulosonic acid transferase [Roseivirga sp. E12]
MLVFYNLGVRCYYFFIKLASLFNNKARLFISGRKNLLSELKNAIGDNHSPITWFHAASLGEFEQGLPVMEAYKAMSPASKILVTFFSPSGFEERKNHPTADFTFYLPIDTPSNAKEFFDIVKPIKVFFIKYEYWFHYLNEAHRRSIPLYSVSALFTPSHIFFKSHGAFHRRMLGFFDHTFVQNDSSLQLLKSIGIEKASISGDSRFDRVLKTIANPQQYQSIERFKGDDLLMVIGSAWASDMQVLNGFINNSKGLKLIIAPHLIDEGSVQKIYLGLEKRVHRYSESEHIPDNTEVLILDTMGMLSSVYQYGEFAYIGGAFGDGLHNILEAVAFGLPVVFGNEGLEKFPESITLQELGGAFSVSTAAESSEILTKLKGDSAFRGNASSICKKFIEDNRGATEHIIGYLKAQTK